MPASDVCSPASSTTEGCIFCSPPPSHPSFPLALQSYTSSPLDPQARLFYNPAFNDEAIPRMSDSKSVMRCVCSRFYWYVMARVQG